MKLLILSLLLTTSIFAEDAESICNRMVNAQENESGLEFLDGGATSVLTRENWNSIDVITAFGYEQCKDAVREELIEFEGKKYWSFRTVEDSCDGGNTYGVIYSYDLKTPIAHIYDGDMYCKSDFSEDQRAVNYKCNQKAEAEAVKKMKAIGFDLTETETYLQIRKPYIYSYVFVSGRIESLDKSATVKVLVNIDSCKLGGSSISRLPL